MSRYLEIHYLRYQHILDLIDSLHLPSGAKILDLGCYPPYLSNHLSKKGFDVYGVSSEHEKIKHPKVFNLNLEVDKFPTLFKGFHLVILSEVVEHLSIHPEFLFRQVTRSLAKGGYLLITTPNVLRIQNIVRLLVGQNIYFPIFQLKQHPNHRHHREYTHDELISYFDKLPLKKVKAYSFIAYPPFRQKNRFDPFFLKTVKFINYLFMLLWPTRRDTLLLLLQKS